MDAAPLLATKLHQPIPRPGLVSRPRLLPCLDEGLQPGKHLVLVSAPAGYGKTTLVSSWLSRTGIPSAWLSLDEGDNDPIRFLQYLAAALRTIVPGRDVDLPGMFQAAHPARFNTFVNLVINEIAAHPAPFVLVLDDFHVVHAQPILEMLATLLDHIPAQMHLVLVSRTDPPIPLARLRARSQMVEVRAEQLRFSVDEVGAFLTEVMGLKLSAEDIAAMEARTEGWIAGLQLAALSMQGCGDSHAFVGAFTGSHAYVMDYLVQEVLKLQPEHVRTFLLQTSILDRLCGPLCDAVVDPSTADTGPGQATLETLEGMSLFLIRLDDERRWYRYHHLFADVLNRHLEHLTPRQAPELHRRASEWYAQNGLIPEATRHAVMAGDRKRAAKLIEQNGCELMMRGEVTTLLKWIEAVEPLTQTRPWLGILYAWALALTGQVDRVEPILQAAEHQLSALRPTAEVRIMLGTMAAARAQRANMQGDGSLAVDFARQALGLLPDADPFSRSLRSVATSIFGDATRLGGDLKQAEHAYAEAVTIGRSAGNVHLVIIVSSNLADVLLGQGRLYEAARLYSDALRMATRPDGVVSPLAESIYAGLSRVYYELNQLDASLRYAQQCIELCRRWRSPDFEAAGFVMLARLERAQGRPDRARAAMQAAEQLANEGRLAPGRATWVKSVLARLWIAWGDVDRASYFVQQSGITVDDEISHAREPEYLALLRLLLARGETLRALTLAERLLEKAEAAHRTGRIIEILVLQALALQGQKNTDRALMVLGKAFALAQPRGYVRVFLDEGENMAKLLHQARAHQVGATFAGELLSTIGLARGAQPAPEQPLIEPLSPRELEVLRLIEAGRSNQEIAEQLVIALPTVKRHISTLYGKLGAKSRTQAISLGRDLGLFE